MRKKLLVILFLCYGALAYSQLTCPKLTSPINGSTNVPVNTLIEWNGISGAPGYLISIGTTPGGIDIINNRNVGNATSYQPPLGLPDDSDIYVTITIFFFNAANIECPSEMFRTENVTEPPTCTNPRIPALDAVNVNISTSISWDYAPTATGYLLSIGTSDGGTDILNNENIVSSPFYQPLVDLPVDTEIFVSIIPYNENGSATGSCSTYSFTTGALAIIPNCTSLVSPSNGAINVALSPVLEWVEVPDAEGYRVTIGTTPFNGNVVTNTTFLSNSSLFIEFEANLTFFVTIIPFNAAGDAIGCAQESFSTILGCGPFFNSITGEFVDLAPEINMPDSYGLCKNELPFIVTSTDVAEGYRWYQVDINDNETLLSMNNTVEIVAEGRYKYEAYNTASQSGTTIECANSQIFTVASSEKAIDLSLNVTGQNGTLDIVVQNSGIGNYEYAIDDSNGPFQDNPNFGNIDLGLHVFYVRDKNGCGIAEINFEQDLTLEGFPKFFTPNGDGVNDFWQILPPTDGSEIEVGSIEIFDRYGSFLAKINPKSIGWDGRFNGRPLPASGYWFRTYVDGNKELKGYFALKR